MKKYSFLVFYKEYEAFLEKLREQGVVHVQTKDEGVPEDDSLNQNVKLVKRYNAVLKELQKVEEPVEWDCNTAEEVINTYESAVASIEKLKNEVQRVAKDIAQVLPWGDFSTERIKTLQESDIYLHLYTCSSSKVDETWVQEYDMFEVANTGSMQYFVCVTNSETAPDIDADHITLPNENAAELNAEKLTLLSEVEKEESVIIGCASKIGLVEELLSKLYNEINFKNVLLNTSAEADEKVMVLEGWAPEAKVEGLEKLLNAEAVYFEARSAEIEDSPPVKLKNNKFAKLFEPISDLYTLPTYGELDLTPFFAPFYMLFFGFCLGDAGYGLLIVLATTIYKRKAKGSMKLILSLGQWLGLSTTIMGVLGGTFFGIFLVDSGSSLTWFKDYQAYILNNDNLMALSLILGFVQICFGMSIKIANKIIQFGFRHAISSIGWTYAVMGGGLLFALNHFGVVEADSAQSKYIYFVLIPGLFLAYFFNSPGKNVFLNLGSGLWDTYNMITGLLGDLLSYIRLFALGIASAILGNVFNQLAVQMSGDIPVVSQLVMVLILLFGHSLNLFMAALGAFVHPLRLTFVEFYKNSGFTGGGGKYTPFKASEVAE